MKCLCGKELEETNFLGYLYFRCPTYNCDFPKNMIKEIERLNGIISWVLDIATHSYDFDEEPLISIIKKLKEVSK